jgi:hypothetical protein
MVCNASKIDKFSIKQLSDRTRSEKDIMFSLKY